MLYLFLMKSCTTITRVALFSRSTYPCYTAFPTTFPAQFLFKMTGVRAVTLIVYHNSTTAGWAYCCVLTCLLQQASSAFLKCLDFFSAASMSFAISTAHLKVKFASVRNCFWVISLCNRQINRSCNDSSKFLPNSQLAASLQSLATYLVMLSSGTWFLLWKLNLSAIIIFFSSKCFFNSVSNSAKVLSCGFLVIVGYTIKLKCSLQQCWGKPELSFHHQWH